MDSLAAADGLGKAVTQDTVYMLGQAHGSASYLVPPPDSAVSTRTKNR